MLTHTSQLSIIVLLAILLPSAFSFPYSIYDMKNLRRASRANSNNPAYAPASRQRYDSPSSFRSPSSSQYNIPDTLYDSGADNYYVDDDSEDERPEREYLYGKPTYHGEYKPTRYYYARAPSYNYYNDHPESTNPLDDLHEEMLQEDHIRQRNSPTGKANWFQNTGQPKSLTSNFMKNLMLYNNGMNTEDNTQPIEMNNAYEDEEVENPYFNDLSNQNTEPIDYFDPLKFQTHQLNHYDSSSSNKPNYYNHENRKEDENHMANKNRKQYDYKDADSHEDKEEKDLESLRKTHKNSWNTQDSDDDDEDDVAAVKQLVNDASTADKSKHEDVYNGGYDNGYDTGFDYDEDEWINWNRKRSLPQKQLRPLKALEYELTKALHQQADTSKVSTTSMPTTSTTRLVKAKR